MMTITKKMNITPVAAAMIFAIGTLASTAPASAKVCASNSVTGQETRTGLNAKSRAKSQAKKRWKDTASATYGRKFRHWGKSQNKQFGCTQSNPGWTCTYTATPCRSGN